MNSIPDFGFSKISESEQIVKTQKYNKFFEVCDRAITQIGQSILSDSRQKKSTNKPKTVSSPLEATAIAKLAMNFSEFIKNNPDFKKHVDFVKKTDALIKKLARLGKTVSLTQEDQVMFATHMSFIKNSFMESEIHSFFGGWKENCSRKEAEMILRKEINSEKKGISPVKFFIVHESKIGKPQEGYFEISELTSDRSVVHQSYRFFAGQLLPVDDEGIPGDPLCRPDELQNLLFSEAKKSFEAGLHSNLNNNAKLDYATRVITDLEENNQLLFRDYLGNNLVESENDEENWQLSVKTGKWEQPKSDREIFDRAKVLVPLINIKNALKDVAKVTDDSSKQNEFFTFLGKKFAAELSALSENESAFVIEKVFNSNDKLLADFRKAVLTELQSLPIQIHYRLVALKALALNLEKANKALKVTAARELIRNAGAVFHEDGLNIKDLIPLLNSVISKKGDKNILEKILINEQKDSKIAYDLKLVVESYNKLVNKKDEGETAPVIKAFRDLLSRVEARDKSTFFRTILLKAPDSYGLLKEAIENIKDRQLFDNINFELIKNKRLLKLIDDHIDSINQDVKFLKSIENGSREEKELISKKLNEKLDLFCQEFEAKYKAVKFLDLKKDSLKYLIGRLSEEMTGEQMADFLIKFNQKMSLRLPTIDLEVIFAQTGKVVIQYFAKTSNKIDKLLKEVDLSLFSELKEGLIKIKDDDEAEFSDFSKILQFPVEDSIIGPASKDLTGVKNLIERLNTLKTAHALIKKEYKPKKRKADPVAKYGKGKAAAPTQEQPPKAILEETASGTGVIYVGENEETKNTEFENRQENKVAFTKSTAVKKPIKTKGINRLPELIKEYSMTKEIISAGYNMNRLPAGLLKYLNEGEKSLTEDSISKLAKEFALFKEKFQLSDPKTKKDLMNKLVNAYLKDRMEDFFTTNTEPVWDTVILPLFSNTDAKRITKILWDTIEKRQPTNLISEIPEMEQERYDSEIQDLQEAIKIFEKEGNTSQVEAYKALLAEKLKEGKKEI